ncbi:MAG: hypothetical protein HYR85_20795 [Planctomycetes bacterium]|nr:hypothetical protein [Planctomycetota bacterium]MBI3846924.1 hypothetical protein [Planctomycetota bacterium]
MKTASLLVLIALAVPLVSCATTYPYQSSPIYVGIPPDLVWDTTIEVVQRDYPLAVINRGKWTFESRWSESLQPMRFQGTRWRVQGQVTRDEDGNRVELRVMKQRNENIDTPLDSSAAQWGHEEPDEMSARILLQRIEAILRPYARERRSR